MDKSVPGSLFRQSLVIPNSDPWDRFVHPYLTLMSDSYIIMQLLLKKSFTPKRGDPHSAILFILSTGTGITPLTDSSDNAFRC